MVELSDVLVSGDLAEIKLDTTEIKASVKELQAALADGINLPQISAADAADKSLFYNTDNSKVCWKDSGYVFKLRMQLVT